MAEPKRTVVVAEITAEWLAEHRPEVAAHFRTEGENAAAVSEDVLEAARTEARAEGEQAARDAAEQAVNAERARITAIRGMAGPGQEEVVAELIESGADRGAAAERLLAHAREKGGSVLDAMRTATETTPPPASPTPTGENTNQTPAALGASMVESARAAGVVR